MYYFVVCCHCASQVPLHWNLVLWQWETIFSVSNYSAEWDCVYFVWENRLYTDASGTKGGACVAAIFNCASLNLKLLSWNKALFFLILLVLCVLVGKEFTCVALRKIVTESALYQESLLCPCILTLKSLSHCRLAIQSPSWTTVMILSVQQMLFKAWMFRVWVQLPHLHPGAVKTAAIDTPAPE